MRALMIHTNVTPFRLKYRHECTYTCYFCPCTMPGFDNPEDLREHTSSEHADKEIQIEFALRPYNLNQMVRIDITNLTCSCDEEVKWPDMLEHLKTEHEVTDIDEAWKKIVPYNLLKSPERDNTCVFCDFTASFRQLDTHMNTHYANFICGDCGKPFVTNQRLKTHAAYHEGGQYTCEKCDQVFPNPHSLRQHNNKMHEKKLLLKCPVCTARFHKDWQKLAHLKAEHEDMLETMGVNCKLCNKSFWSNDYRRHVIRDHSLFGCSECNRKFDTQKRLDAHGCRTHLSYQCDLCLKVCTTVRGIVGHKVRCQEKHKKRAKKEK